jgi:hypothetical protein
MTKIGRNEPCPCGSGKKYKTVVGANRRNPILLKRSEQQFGQNVVLRQSQRDERCGNHCQTRSLNIPFDKERFLS